MNATSRATTARSGPSGARSVAAAHNYDYQRYSSDRNCYQKADNKGLSGDKRRKFINNCLDKN